MYDSSIANTREFSLEIEIDRVEKNDLIPKLAIHDIMRRLQDNSKTLKKRQQ